MEDKVNIIQMFREKTKQLQIIRKSQLEEEDDSNSETLNTQVNEINLANQLIGEVQGFIFVVRWLIYEFYQFKKFNQQGYLQFQDMEALKEDILFICHKIIVGNEVFETLIVLSRIFNNKTDKRIRDKYKEILKDQSPYFPLEIWPSAGEVERKSSRSSMLGAADRDGSNISNVTGYQVPVIEEIILKCIKKNQKPFTKAIMEFKSIM